MIRMISAKYAFRSLFRHTRRTILSVVGVGVGCGIAIMAASWIGGEEELMLRAASESGAGHVRIAPKGWVDQRENSLRLEDWQDAMAQVMTLPGVRAVATRARISGLLAFGNRMSGVEIVGVLPEGEKQSNRVVWKSTIEGRYLQSDDTGKTVIGKALAKRLDVELDDDLLVTVAGREDIESAMLRVVGILATGSTDLDTGFCQVTLSDLEQLTSYDGPGEIAILLKDHKLIESTRETLAEKLGGKNDVLTWKEVSLEMAANIDGDKAFTNILVAIIIVVVALGITSAQLTAVLERRHEFAILSALGMKSRQLVGLIMLEAVAVGLGGAVVAMLFGGGIAYRLANVGYNMAKYLEGDLAMGDVLLDPIMYGEFGPWIIWYSLGISLVATLTASLYPAWFVTKTNPANALREV